MSRIQSPIVLLLFLIFCFSPVTGASNHNVDKIVKAIDELYRSKTSYAEIEMEIVTPHWQRTLRMKIWTEGMDKTFIRIIEPKKERGVATLRIGSEMWNYLPKVNKVIKIPPSMMMSSWMGSDFTNDDLVKEFSLLKDYRYRLIQPDNAEKGLLYLECIPKKDVPVVWGKVIVAVREADYIPVWEKYYDEKGKLMRIFYFKDIKQFGGKKIPSVMELIPQNKKGHKTVIRYLKAEFNIPLRKDIFTLRNLQSTR